MAPVTTKHHGHVPRLFDFGSVGAPAPAQIRAGRLAAGLTQPEAANLIHGSKRARQDWEAGVARMHPGLWELFVLKTSIDALGQVASSGWFQAADDRIKIGASN